MKQAPIPQLDSDKSKLLRKFQFAQRTIQTKQAEQLKQVDEIQMFMLLVLRKVLSSRKSRQEERILSIEYHK